MKQANFLVTGLLAGLLVLSFGFTAFAQVEESSRGDSVEELLERQQQRRTTIQPDAQRAARLVGVCESAESKLQAAQDRLGGVLVNRADTYANISTQLTNLIQRLEAAGVDVASLQAEVTAYEEQVTTYQSTATDYQVALEDALLLGCEDDPEGFLVALEAARIARSAVVTQSQEIKQYLRVTVFSTVNEIKSTIQAGTEEV